MRTTCVLVALTGWLLAAALPTAARAAARRAEVRKDVEYGRADGERLLLDLYLPANGPATAATALRPGIVFVHGGGWTGGDKSGWARQAAEMAGRGYVCVSVNYRLAPKHRYPAAVEDVQTAVRWLRAHAAEFRLDPRRVGSMGDSAGGHLASMLGVLDTLDRRVPADAPSSRVNCVVDYYGRMDLTLEPVGTGGVNYRPGFIGKSNEEGLALYQEASPINHIDARTVPFLIVQGTRDQQVEPAQSEHMMAALDKAGVEATLVMLAGQGHGFRGKPAQEAWTIVKAWLDRQLR